MKGKIRRTQFPLNCPTGPSAVIVAIMFYLHRVTRQDLKDLRLELANLRDRMDSLNGDLRDRMGRIEGSLDLLREFFVGSGRGIAA